jgi:hypothetical protein
MEHLIWNVLEEHAFRPGYADGHGEWKLKLSTLAVGSWERKEHMSMFYRQALGESDDPADRASGRRSWSFCRTEWNVGTQLYRHCPACGECLSLEEYWHCGVCEKCQENPLVPCSGCGGIAEDLKVSREIKEKRRAERDKDKAQRNLIRAQKIWGRAERQLTRVEKKTQLLEDWNQVMEEEIRDRQTELDDSVTEDEAGTL